MKQIVIIQVMAFTLLFCTILVLLYQYRKYLGIKEIYRSDYARASFIRSIGSLLPFVPAYKSARYKKTESLMINSGLGASVESFYLVKTLLFISGLVFFTSVHTTNYFQLYDSIISDLNTGKSLMERVAAHSEDKVKLEKEIFRFTEKCLPKEKIELRRLVQKENSKLYTEYLEVRIKEAYKSIEEDAGAIAGRMYEKLVRVRKLETGYSEYVLVFFSSLILYFLPNIACNVKLKLIEDKRDWEILNYIHVFSIFGRMPPFNIRGVLANMLLVSDIYRPIINEALNGVKTGRVEAAFNSLLHKVENEDLYELLETMRLAAVTGFLEIVDSIDEMALNQLKWLEIKGIKRRKSKQVVAMIPVVLVMLVAVVYFSYSLSTLSNPMNYIK